MKMLRMLSTWLMVLACFSLTTTSCIKIEGLDDEEDEEEIVDEDEDEDEEIAADTILGSWQLNGGNYIETITFNDDGTFNILIKDYYEGEWSTKSESGTYTYANNVITLKVNGTAIAYFHLKSVTSTSLTIEDEKDSDYTVTYKKV